MHDHVLTIPIVHLSGPCLLIQPISLRIHAPLPPQQRRTSHLSHLFMPWERVLNPRIPRLPTLVLPEVQNIFKKTIELN